MVLLPLDELRTRLATASDDTERRALVAAAMHAHRHAGAPEVILGRWRDESGKDVPVRLFAWPKSPFGDLVLALSSRRGWQLLLAADIEEAEPLCFRLRPVVAPPPPNAPAPSALATPFRWSHRFADASAAPLTRAVFSARSFMDGYRLTRRQAGSLDTTTKEQLHSTLLSIRPLLAEVPLAPL